jgi:hypothetical protein
LTPAGEELLQGRVPPEWHGNNDLLQEFLASFAIPQNVKEAEAIKTEISEDDFVYGIKHWSEKTSTSPSARTALGTLQIFDLRPSAFGMSSHHDEHRNSSWNHARSMEPLCHYHAGEGYWCATHKLTPLQSQLQPVPQAPMGILSGQTCRKAQSAQRWSTRIDTRESLDGPSDAYSANYGPK